MDALKLLHKNILKSQVITHQYRLTAVMKAVESILCGGKLTLTHLGRNLPEKIYEKHKIKCIDRLLGNSKLHNERHALYRLMGHWLLCGVKHPVIIVDWSDVYEGQKFVMLTAAIPVGGRTLTLFEQVYPMKQYNSPKAHKQFLKELAQVVPKNKRPIIVTDAVFRGPWFHAVNALGWDWVGRIRKSVYVSLNQGKRTINTVVDLIHIQDLRLNISRQQGFNVIYRFCLRQFSKKITKIRIRFQAIGLSSFN